MTNPTADQIKAALTAGNPPRWVQQAALLMHPNQWEKAYDTTAVNFFPEVTVRLPVDGLTRRGKPRFQRRRLDLVALVQPNYRQWTPFTIGLEIKVDKHDLHTDQKMVDYLPYVHLFYIAVPASLLDDLLLKVSHGFDLDNAGLLVIKNDGQVVVWGRPVPSTPTGGDLNDVYSELLIRPFRRAGKTCKTFIEFERKY